MNTIINEVWPTAVHKVDRQSNANNNLQGYFSDCTDRYAFDFSKCGLKSDWYQYDTSQDASYHGSWVNPVTRQVISFLEGDIYLTTCETIADYKREIEAMDNWNKENGYALKRHSIDNHDGQHWDKLGEAK